MAPPGIRRRRLIRKSTLAQEISTKLSLGEVVGEVLEGNVCHFSGIPFAAPPVGPLRWRRPVPASPWPDRLDCTRRRAAGERTAAPLQFGGDEADDEEADDEPDYDDPSWVPEFHEAEDCLYANVWAPQEAVRGAQEGKAEAPVLVYVHGGALIMGYATDADNNGTAYANRGCVTFNFNYRVGPMGWFQPDGGDANCGLWDAVTMLRWVKTEARAFGGNPDNITLLGQSGGADVVFWLCTSPVANRLFNRAIIESYGSHTWTLGQVREITDEFAKVAGAASSSLEDMQALTVEQIKAAADSDGFSLTPNQQPGYRFDTYPNIAPQGPKSITAAGNLRLPKTDTIPSPSAVIDGELLPMQPLDALISGVAGHLQIIVGSSRFETSGPHVSVDLTHALAWEFAGAPGSGQASAATLHAAARIVQEAYEKECIGSGKIRSQKRSKQQEAVKMRLVRNSLFSDLTYAVYAYLVAERLALPGNCRSGYYFEFTGTRGWNSSHGVQFQYSYGPHYKSDTDLRLRETWLDSYTAFIHTGDPNTPAILSGGGWRPCEGNGGSLMRWDTKQGCRFSSDGHRDRNGLRTLGDLYERLWQLQPVTQLEESRAACFEKLGFFAKGKTMETSDACSDAESTTTAGSESEPMSFLDRSTSSDSIIEFELAGEGDTFVSQCRKRRLEMSSSEASSPTRRRILRKSPSIASSATA